MYLEATHLFFGGLRAARVELETYSKFVLHLHPLTSNYSTKKDVLINQLLFQIQLRPLPQLQKYFGILVMAALLTQYQKARCIPILLPATIPCAKL